MLATLDAIEPRAAGNNGAWSLPDGAAYYAQRLRQSTTTDLDRRADPPDRPRPGRATSIGEMERIKAPGRLHRHAPAILRPHQRGPGVQISEHRRRAGRPISPTPARFIAQVMAAAPRWFRRLPRAPLEVRAVEAFRQETAAVAFYNRPSPDGSRPGIFYVNLADMNQVLRPQVEAIAYHEGAPGHHFQIALAQELRGRAQVPPLRRLQRLCRGLGPLCRGAGQGDGLLPRADQRVRHALDPAVAGDPAGRRHRHPPPALDPRAGDRLFHGTTACSRAATRPRRSSAISTIPARRPAT